MTKMDEGKRPEAKEQDHPKVETPVTTQDKLEKIRKLMEDNDTPMVTTVSGTKLISRPMKLQEAEYDGTLWFFTTKDTAKYNEIKNDSRVNIGFAGKGYLSMSGTAEVVEDVALKKRLWNRWAGKFFGIEHDDANLVLIKVNAESAEYWENVGRIKSVVTTIKSIAGDTPPDEAINSSIELDGEKA